MYSDGDTQEAKKCTKAAGGIECKTFAVRRSIKWDNGVDKKALKIKFTSKDSIQDIKDKLTKLGFMAMAALILQTLTQKLKTLETI